MADWYILTLLWSFFIMLILSIGSAIVVGFDSEKHETCVSLGTMAFGLGILWPLVLVWVAVRYWKIVVPLAFLCGLVWQMWMVRYG